MIQRIQTLYLLIGLVLMVITIFTPLGEILTGNNEIYLFTSKGVHYNSGDQQMWVFHSWPLFILILSIIILFAVILSLFKKRKLQMRLCVYNMLLQIGLLGLMYYYFSVIFRRMNAIEYNYRLAVILPVLTIILTYLAFRGIRKDEILIRSIDKIR